LLCPRQVLALEDHDAVRADRVQEFRHARRVDVSRVDALDDRA